MSRIRLEVCVDTPAGLAAAVAGGADRIELCAALSAEGLTPAPGLMAQAARCGCATFAMIRPRPGDFVFDARELDTMRGDIAAAAAAGLAGVVLGANRADGRLDEAALADQVAQATAAGLGVALHRAFDLTPDKAEALEAAIALGFPRILTSGGRRSAPEGAEVIAELVQRAGERAVILAGAGLRPQNVAAFVRRTGVREVHGSCRAPLPPAPAGRPDVALGFTPAGLADTSAAVVAAMVAALAGV